MNCFAFVCVSQGQEVLSGSQRIHCKELLIQRIKDFKYDTKSFQHFTETFRYIYVPSTTGPSVRCYELIIKHIFSAFSCRCEAPPRGGFGAGLERIVTLYLGLPDIRIASLFPRDPDRLFP